MYIVNILTFLLLKIHCGIYFNLIQSQDWIKLKFIKPLYGKLYSILLAQIFF
ncbi:hypothetical protein CULT_1920004 [[Clostridium] ultunense Esp]|nr:hypothetical protein CULT_1920004 [[Clostridium] ultunense Esp]